ncbi:hypothetical protein ABZ568_06300 [Streptomyces olindensis]|uniref:Uncharacterized protein n=1 Tax=Streptomyces olindensis TaxID=358823 RepID=A0ABV2XPW2_9ACTN
MAAEADTLGAQVRALLLDSARDASEAVATVVALVCQGEFAEHYPRQALVRLRHILDRPEPDEAVRTAQEALRDIAANEGQLPRVWSTVIKWATQKKRLAGHRAFLSLLDPPVDPYVLQVMLAAAEQKKDIKEALVEGWSVALRSPSAQCVSRNRIHRPDHCHAPHRAALLGGRRSTSPDHADCRPTHPSSSRPS